MPRCAHCGAGSDYLQHGFDSFSCLRCGNLTDYEGNPLPVEPAFPDTYVPSQGRPI